MISNSKIKAIISKAFGSGDLSRDRINYAVRCPACNDSKINKKKLIIRLDDGRYHCWVCGTKGKNVASLIKRYRPEILEIAGIKFGSTAIEESKSIDLPKGFVRLFNYSGSDPDINSTLKYLKSRGITSGDMARWRMLAYKTGRFRRRVLIPSFDDAGDLNYYIARTIDDIKPKYRNANIKKIEIVFNEIDIDWSKPIVLVEGVFDAFKAPENTVPMLGSTLAKGSLLYNRLVSSQSEVFLSLDPDMKNKAFDTAKMLSKMGCPVYISFAPTGKDLGQMSKDEVRKILDSSVLYRSEDRLYHKIGKIRSGSVI